MFVKCSIILIFVRFCLTIPTTVEEVKAQNFRNDTTQDLSSKGYLLIGDTQNEIEYLVSTRIRARYFYALHICREYKMELFRVNSREKNEIIRNIITTYAIKGPFWMGGNRVSVKGTWKWADGTLITYFNWDVGEPNNAKGNEECIEVYQRDAKWDDQMCMEEIFFICEAPKSTKTDKQDLTTNNGKQDA